MSDDRAESHRHLRGCSFGQYSNLLGPVGLCARHGILALTCDFRFKEEEPLAEKQPFFKNALKPDLFL